MLKERMGWVKETKASNWLVKRASRIDFVQNRALDFLKKRLNSGDVKLSPAGQEVSNDFFNSVKKDEKVSLAECIGVLDTYGLEEEGLDALEDLKGKSFLLLSNHSNEGPLRGFGNTIFVSNVIKRLTGKEPRWAHGQDKSTLSDIARKKLNNSLNTILVREKSGYKGASNIVESFRNEDIIGIYPEGDSGNNLKRANAKAGHFIYYATRKGIPIICAAADFRAQSKFFVTFLRLDGQKVLDLYNSTLDKHEARQMIADYAMNEIASHLPKEKRGYYSQIQI